jgi:hypothetical protein
MAALQFRNFSFERHPPSFHEMERAAMNVSPTSTPSEYPLPLQRPPTPPPTLGDLAHVFGQQSLHVEPLPLHVEVDPAYNFSPSNEPITPPADESLFPCDSAPTADRPTYSRISTASLRLQRQSNARRHCSSSHLKNISKLVEQMVEEEDQCNVCDKTSPVPSSSSSVADEDEGVDMDYTPPSPLLHDDLAYTVRFRRSGDRLNSSAAVSKNVRMRKPSKITKRSSR